MSGKSSDTPAMTSRSRVVVLACSWLMIFSAYSSVLCVSPILSLLAQSFGLTASRSGIVFSAPIVTLGLFAIAGGLLGDRIGPRKTAGFGGLILCLSGAFRAIALSFETLLVLNLVVGIGWALVFPNLPKLVRLWFSEETIGTATGAYSTGVFAGSTVALGATVPVILPLVAGWRGVFVVWGGIALAINVLWWCFAREPLSFRAGQPPSPKARRAAIAEVIGRRSIWIVAVFFALSANVTFYIVTGWFPTFFLQKGLSVNLSGLLTSLVTVAGFPAVFLVPFASDKTGRRKPFLWTSCILASGAFLGVIWSPVLFDVILMMVLGITLTATYVVSLFLPVELVEPENAGTASGVVISVGYIGGAIGPLLAGYLKDRTGTLVPCVVMLAALMVASAGLTLLIPETGWRKRTCEKSPGGGSHGSRDTNPTGGVR